MKEYNIKEEMAEICSEIGIDAINLACDENKLHKYVDYLVLTGHIPEIRCCRIHKTISDFFSQGQEGNEE